MRVCVFGSSSTKTDAKYLDAAFELGQLIGKSPKFVCVNGGEIFHILYIFNHNHNHRRKINIFYAGGNAGVMGALNKGCRSVGGEIVGVIHGKLFIS